MSVAIWSLLFLEGCSTLTNWWSAHTYKRRTYAISKVLVMLVWIALFVLVGGAKRDGIWFLLALLFSLAGDIFLLFSMRVFLLGLYAFFISHVFFIIGFNQIPPTLAQVLIGGAIVIILTLAVGFLIQAKIAHKPELQKFRIPIIAYSIVLSSMAVSAGLSLFKAQYPVGAACLALVGGLLFLASDSMLAYNRFVKRFRAAPLLVIMTYHLAQFALILGYLWMAGLL